MFRRLRYIAYNTAHSMKVLLGFKSASCQTLSKTFIMRCTFFSTLGLLASVASASLQIVPGATWTAVCHSEIVMNKANTSIRRTPVSISKLMAVVYSRLAISGTGMYFTRSSYH
jgi:branched-subunit amino acid transport protein